MSEYIPAIGLEIHAELATKTKMFCYSLNDPNEQHPNVNICPICMGHPGTLPVINEEAVKKVITVGLAVGGTIAEYSQFDRKNYFYPDLPKGYQISQYPHPLVQNGVLQLPGAQKEIRIERIHLEEDTGRLIHEGGPSTSSGRSASLIDFNRAGVPLMELVTHPDFTNGEEVREFGEALQRIVRYVGASEANMEKGQMRVEVNVSVRKDGEALGTKVEVKNINSFAYAAAAAAYEIKRQSRLLEQGEAIVQETRGWNEHKQQTFSQRSKEEAHDYRYFPEPDLPPLRLSAEYVDALRAALPELPAAKHTRFQSEYGLDPEMTDTLIRDKSLADFFEQVVSEARQHDKETPEVSAKQITKTAGAFLVGDMLRILNEQGMTIGDTRISAENFAELIVYFAEDNVSNTSAKQVLLEMFRSGEDPSDIIERLGLWQMSDAGDLENIVSHIIKENPKAVEDFRAGKGASVQFLVGQVMKETRGTANPKMVTDIITQILSS